MNLKGASIRRNHFWPRCLSMLLFLLANSLASAETFHAIIISETSDPKIQQSVQTDARLAVEFARKVGRHFDTSSISVLTGEDASKSTVQAAIASLSLDHDDFVFIFYSGHGDRSGVAAPWPNISLLEGSLEGIDLLLRLSGQPSLRHLVVFDACNGTNEMPQPDCQPPPASIPSR